MILKRLGTCILIIAAVLAVLLAGCRIVGFTPYTVLSGSMEPTYKVGSVIYVEKVDAGELKENQPVTFVMDEELHVATHRIVAIDYEKKLIYTKGDANKDRDAEPVSFKNVIGKPVFSIPYLGYVSNFLSNAVHSIV